MRFESELAALFNYVNDMTQAFKPSLFLHVYNSCLVSQHYVAQQIKRYVNQDFANVYDFFAHKRCGSQIEKENPW